MKTHLFAAAALLATSAYAADPAAKEAPKEPPKSAVAQPPKHKDEVAGDGLMVHKDQLLKQKPAVEVPGGWKAWLVEKGDDAGSFWVEVNGYVPWHFHPDGNHRVYIMEGEFLMNTGGTEMVMKAGDYMYIPKGVRHRMALNKGSTKAVFVTVDTPPIDPKKTVWLEPKPNEVKQADKAPAKK